LTVSTNGKVSITEVLEVAVTTICDEVDNVEDVVAHPVSILMAATPTKAISSICRRRRFLSPPIHSSAANVPPANSGLGLRCTAAVVAGAVTVRVVVALARASVVTVVGLKAQEAPTGRNPEQLKAIEPLNAAFAVIVRVTDPLPPAGTVMIGFEEVMVNAGGGKLMTYTAEVTALLL
jgi:hypothetical protein